MRRNRLKWIRVSTPTVTINAPNVFRRLLMVQCHYHGAVAGEGIALRFSAKVDGSFQTIGFTKTGPCTDTGGEACWALGGTINANNETASGAADAYTSDPLITGALPDVWWNPDLPAIFNIDATSGATVDDWSILLEECDLSEG